MVFVHSKVFLVRLLASAFLFGVLAGIFLNWAEFALILTHFAALWAITTNRPEILRLTSKLLLFGVLTAGAFAIFPLCSSLLGDNKATAPRAPSPAKQSLPPTAALRAASRVPAHVRTAPASSHSSSAQGLPPVVRQSSPLSTSTRTGIVPSVPPPPGSIDHPVTPPPPSISSGQPKAPPQGVPQGARPSPDGPSQVAAASPPLASAISATPRTSEATKEDIVYPVKGTPALEIARPAVSGERITLDITALKRLDVSVRIPGSAQAYPVEVERLSLKAQLLIAYIASARGKVPLGTLRDAVFGTDAAYPEQVQQSFSTAKRDVRRRMDDAVDLARSELGAALVPEDLALDVFRLVKNKRYRLPEYCHVCDLDLLWQQYRVIEQAQANRELVQSVPDHVQRACQQIIAAWQGDFIEDLLDQAEHAALIDDWPNSWAREPFTQFRRIYLEAILYAAEYERKRGNADTNRRKEYYEAAAALFAKGALAACNPRVFDGRFDLKVSFNKDPIGPHGSHVSRSEQYLRRAEALYGIIGDTTRAAQLFADYCDQMQVCSGGAWSPHPKTTSIVESVGQRTGAYQFSELVEVPDDLSR